MALMLVLAALALLSFLVLLVLTITRNEDRASKASADTIDVQTLSDLPAQLVISQIRRATSNLGTGYTWASQPGMIRVFASGNVDSSGRAGLYEAYKLYSSDRMAVVGTEFDATKEKDKLTGWENSPALLTDLNEPVPLRPVVKSGGSTSGSTGADARLVYPIIDPGALKVVDGFELDSSAVPGASDAQPAPMPVMWLYVLADGRVIAPSGGSSTTATFASGSASTSNPIVARIAFWADDESCKINLNTASEPAPWDEPRANSMADRAHAAFQPAQNEFHRQPGHPAFTALSPVFQAFGRDSTNTSATSIFTPAPDPAGISLAGVPNSNSSADAQKFRDYVDANQRPLPRTPDSTSTTNRDRGSRQGTQRPKEKVTLKTQRLFSTIDELLFDIDRKPMKVSGDGLNVSQTLTEDDVRRTRFFLTTRNAAPETNPFNRPKISLWPMQQEATLRTAFDRRMALASSVSGKEYFWQRATAWKSAASPGSSQSTSDDARIKRNAQIIGYLQSLAATTMPGYGGSLEGKYGGGQGSPTNCDQIITAMFDMLRWGANIENDNRDAGTPYTYLPPGRHTDNTTQPAGEYSAAPLIVAGTGSTQVRGFGRFPTVTEVAFVVVATEAEKKDGSYVDENGDRLADKTQKLRLFVIVEPACPVAGSPAMTPAVRYRISGLENLKIDDNALFQAGYRNTNRATSSGTTQTRVIEGATNFNGLASQFLQPDGQPKTLGGADEDAGFPFASAEVALSSAKTTKDTLSLKGEPLTLEILPAYGETTADDAVQVLRIPIPAECSIPVPVMNLENSDQGDARIEGRFRLITDRDGTRQKLIQKGDVVRSVEADPTLDWRGDLRLLALTGTRGSAPVTYKDDPDGDGDPSRSFFPARTELTSRWSETDESKRALHSLRSGASTTLQYGMADASESSQTNQSTGSPLLPGFTYPSSFTPTVVSPPRESNLSFSGAIDMNGRLGDWCNGPGLLEDGPFICCAGFGNTPTETAAAGDTAAGGFFQRGGDVYPDTTGMNAAPYRQFTSGITFGAVPTGVFPRTPGGDGADATSRPWQTLLFCPNPLSRKNEAGSPLEKEDHFGFFAPPDHTWLEFFWLPVVDPQPLSSGLSTLGKVNMNTQIMPFSYIKRTTAMHAALRGVRITAIPCTAASSDAGDDFYKHPSHITGKEFRYQVNATETLKGFDEERFKKGDVFRTASEICEMFLVPKRVGESDTGTGTGTGGGRDYGTATPTTGLTYDKMIAWWNGDASKATDAFEATGDNTRESPYAQLYPRLCTKSNVFQVHYRVQLIKKSRSTDANQVNLAADQITADTRGSAVIERYIDPNDTGLPDMAAEPSPTKALDDYYRYRIVSRQPFIP